MNIFRKRNKKSTLRFCQTATELPSSQLYRNWDLRLAISRLGEWRYDALQETDQAFAYGVVHDIYGHGQPLLPVEIIFCFTHHHTESELAVGRVWKDDWGESESTYYKLDVTVYDPARQIYSRFLRAFEHAAISGNNFAHLILKREKEAYITDATEREAAEKMKSNKIDDMMKKVDSGVDDLPYITFNQIAFDDSIVLKAPRWSHSWHDGFVYEPVYHSHEAASWRNMPWKK